MSPIVVCRIAEVPDSVFLVVVSLDVMSPSRGFSFWMSRVDLLISVSLVNM